MPFDGARVTAVLGPTNTGKTHYAIERMLGHRTGVIGLPLRLLAREVYDRIVAVRGPSVVALITGEERIVPPRAAYWVCTVEAMPLDLGADFLAIDEIQLAADPDRGHVFTASDAERAGVVRDAVPGVGHHARAHRRAGARGGVPAARAVLAADLHRCAQDQPDAAAQCHRGVLGGRRLCHRRADPPAEGRRRRGHGRAEPADAQCAGGPLPERRRGLSRGDRCHRHGVEPRYRACGVLGGGQVRRAAAPASRTQRAGADRRAGGALPGRRDLRGDGGCVAARRGSDRGDREQPLRAASPVAVAQRPAGFRQPRGSGGEPGGALGGTRSGARAGGRRSGDAEGAGRVAGCAAPGGDAGGRAAPVGRLPDP